MVLDCFCSYKFWWTHNFQVEEMAARHCGKVPAVHRWPYARARGPRCNQDIVRIMRSLQPLLQDAIQKKCTTRMWDAPYTVSGPLTWRQFHRLAGRGLSELFRPTVFWRIWSYQSVNSILIFLLNFKTNHINKVVSKTNLLLKINQNKIFYTLVLLISSGLVMY